MSRKTWSESTMFLYFFLDVSVLVLFFCIEEMYPNDERTDSVNKWIFFSKRSNYQWDNNMSTVVLNIFLIFLAFFSHKIRIPCKSFKLYFSKDYWITSRANLSLFQLAINQIGQKRNALSPFVRLHLNWTLTFVLTKKNSIWVWHLVWWAE